MVSFIFGCKKEGGEKSIRGGEGTGLLTSLGESQFLSSGSSAGEEKLQEMAHLYRFNKRFNEEVNSWFSSLFSGIHI